MTKIKICGLTNLEDARVAAQEGADLLGFIFYERSPRYVTPASVKTVIEGLATGQTLPLFVGVFVNKPLETVIEILDFCRLDAAQLHGDEPPAFVKRLDGRAYKALRPQSQTDADKLVSRYLPPSTSPASPSRPSLPLPSLLLDAYHPNLYGGTGHVTDWSMAAHVARQHPIMLAGSLTPDNVAEAVRMVQPWGVDVSSGVEAEKGKKNHEKIKAFVKAVRHET